MNVEERLVEGLADIDEPSFGLDSASMVVQRARRRSTRTRVVAAVMGAVAIGGVGFGLGTVRSDAPSALMATVDDPDGEVVVDDPVGDPFADPTGGNAFDADPPDARLVVGDGEGGFVGADADQFWSTEHGTQAEFRWSPDGVRWKNVGTLEVGDRAMVSLHTVDGDYVAFLQSTERAFEVDGVRTPAGIVDPGLQIARSSDLIAWTITDVPIDFPEVEARYELFELYTSLVGGGVHDGRTILQLSMFVQPDFNELAGEVGVRCGSADTDAGLSVVACDGTRVEVLSSETLMALGLDRRVRYFASDDRGPFTEIDPEIENLAPGLLATDDGFVTVVGTTGQVVRSTDGVNWETAAELPQEREWTLAAAGPAAEVVFVGSGDGADAPDFVTAHVDIATGEIAVRALPLQAEVAPSPHAVNHGPAGWAMVANVRSAGDRGVTRNGWTLFTFDEGASRGTPFYLVREGSMTPDYVLEDRTSAAIERGLFGELRFLSPETGEVLVTASRSELASFRFDRVADSSRSSDPYVSDGWQVSGDPLMGPLVITDPDGNERVFDDGFVFRNADTSDGVELVGGDPVHLDSGVLTLYVDDEVVWTTPFADVIEHLTIEIDDSTPRAQAVAEAGDAWVLRSDDGTSWTVVDEFEDAGFGDHPGIAVGDDEVVVIPFPSWLEDDLVRVPLPS